MGSATRKIGEHAAFLAVELLAAGLTVTAHAQQNVAEKIHFSLPEVAATYDIEHSKIATSPCNCFWLLGGGGEVAVPFYPGWSLVGSFDGSHASNIRPGVDVRRLTWLAGPRFSYDNSRIARSLTGSHSAHVFGEFLAGGAHGFDSVFPTSSGVKSSANSYALEAGGGLDIGLTRSLSLRAVEMDYVRTALPNAATNTQNDLRLAFGVTHSFTKSKK